MTENNISFTKTVKYLIIAVLTVLMVIMFFLRISFVKKDSVPPFFGYTLYQTHGVNMNPSIPKGTVIIAEKAEIGSIKTGSVVLCEINESTVLTRVVGTVEENGTVSYEVRFDMDSSDNVYRVQGENIIARAVAQSETAGRLVDFALSAGGKTAVIIIFGLILILLRSAIKDKAENLPNEN